MERGEVTAITWLREALDSEAKKQGGKLTGKEIERLLFAAADREGSPDHHLKAEVQISPVSQDQIRWGSLITPLTPLGRELLDEARRYATED